jgi:hypothetical protein
MGWAAAERVLLEEVLEKLDKATSDFEDLVGMKTRNELLDKLDRLTQGDLRRIVLIHVVIEQAHRAGRL